jgi:hypothetical protein
VKLTSRWRREIREEWSIETLEPTRPLLRAALWTTRCSKTKQDVVRGKPRDLYVSPINLLFYRWVEERGLRYGVLSDKYGLHLQEEELEYYDLHPSVLTVSDKRRLGETIKKKAVRVGFGTIVFYNPSPLMSVPYFEMLYYSGLDVYYTTVLDA